VLNSYKLITKEFFMALRILIPGDRNSLSTLAASAFTRQNYGAQGATSARITIDTPDGALAGMVAMYSDNYEVDVCSNYKAVGLFLNDASGAPFENTPTVASGKLTVMRSMGSYETDVYETKDEAGAQDLTYTAGDLLYVSDFGLLTSEDLSAKCRPVARTTKAPSATDPWLGLDLLV
jgi:hypothetical protein